MCIVNICCPVCDVITFGTKLSYQADFLHTKKSWQKREYLKNQSKSRKIFSLFLKGYQLSENVSEEKVGF